MKMISANKLNRLWKNGVIAKMVAKTKVLKTMEEISANTNTENVAGATAVKEISNKLASQLQDVRIFSEGSGENIKYYAQSGADTASKKLLGSGIYNFKKMLRVCTASTGQTTAALLIDTWENELTKNNLISKQYSCGSVKDLDIGVFDIDYGKTLGLNYTIKFNQTCLTSDGIYNEGEIIQWKYSEKKNIYIIS